jgi:hypothetical protein
MRSDCIKHIHPWKVNSHSPNQGIPRLLWNLKVYFSIHESPLLVYHLVQMHPVHTFTPCFPQNYYNTTFPSTPRSSKWSLPSNNLHDFLKSTVHATCPPISHSLIWSSNNIWWIVQVMKLLIMQSSSVCIQIFHSAPCSQKASDYGLSCVWENDDQQILIG